MTNLEEAMDDATDVDGLVTKLAAYEAAMARPGADRKGSFQELIDIRERRYLFLSRGAVPILDGRHFFAAMYQELTGEMVNLKNWGDHRGYTLLMGVGNELKQCLDEARARVFNSCFSPEDLGSNRMGYLFARRVLKAREIGVSVNTPQLLRAFLEERGPVSVARVHAAKGPGIVHTAFELSKVPLEFHRRVVESLWSLIVPFSR